MTRGQSAVSAFSRPVVLPTVAGTVAGAGHNTPFCVVRAARASGARGTVRPFTRRL